MIYAEDVLRELVTRPISALVSLIELPGTVQRSLTQANELMESSRRQLEAMQRQTEHALHQAERMNDLLGRVVKLTEPLEKAQRGGEYVGGRLKRALFGEDAPEGANRLERVVEDAEAAAGHAERAAVDAEDAAKHAEGEAESATGEAEMAAEEAEIAAEEARAAEEEAPGQWKPAASRKQPEPDPGK